MDLTVIGLIKDEKIKVYDDQYYAEYFEDTKYLEIYLLSKNDAKRVFSYFLEDRKAHCYFRLQDDNWLFTEGNKRELDGWYEPYNGHDYEPFSLYLKSEIPWDLNESVFSIVNDETVFECSWKTFLDYWYIFMRINDEVMLISPNLMQKQILLFGCGNTTLIQKSY